MPDYTNPNYIKFVEDMREAGYPVQHYCGRWYYEGPAVVTEDYFDEQDVIRATSVRVRSDSMGHGRVVYPC